MAKMWVSLVGSIPIKSVSWNAQMRNPKISYVDIYENAIVKKFHTMIFFGRNVAYVMEKRWVSSQTRK